MSHSELAAFALDIAREASGLIMEILRDAREGMDVRLKSPTELVTRADLESERLITRRIRERFPGHAVLGEEGTADPAEGAGEIGSHPPGAGRAREPRWIVDPVDGTANYAHGVPWFAVSIAHEDHEGVRCGVVAVPPLGEFFVAERGRGAYQVSGGSTVRLVPSRTSELERALIATGLPRRPVRPPHVATIGPMMLQTLEVRVMGAAAIHLAYVAAGRLDAFWEPGLAPWDLAAGTLLVEEAGGRVTDWAGRPLQTMGGQVLASNGALHPAMMEALAGDRAAGPP